MRDKRLYILWRSKVSRGVDCEKTSVRRVIRQQTFVLVKVKQILEVTNKDIFVVGNQFLVTLRHKLKHDVPSEKNTADGT